ncbi:MAG: putative lipid II flippase FtsW, partial [Actinomycetota bacterium]|nr:putative lipid II flippase FtsW [Actinomycetota bacterium]
LSLVAFGLVMVYSATSATEAIGNGDPLYFLKRQTIYAVIGAGLMALAAHTSFHRLRVLSPALVLTSFALCIAVLVIGREVNGARRWLTFGPAVFQPSELAKVAVAIWAAAYLARKGPPRSLGELARPLGLVAGCFCALILLEPDLGTTIAIVVMLGATLLVIGTRPRTLVAAGVIAAALAVAAVWFEPYRRARFFAFVDPWHDAEGAGFQIVQAMIGIGSGGISGRGLGEGLAKIHYLPEAHTDMIFAVIGEELGLIGATGIIGAYALFAYAGLKIALRCRDPFGKTLAAALTALVCGQAAINLAAVLGLAPLTGIPLPFVSYGGSSLVMGLTSVGILLNIAGNHGRRAGAQVPDRRRRNGRTRDAGARSRRRA